jgi:hypothetical protein
MAPERKGIAFQWRDLGNAAHELLAPVCGWFTEGDTLDLKEAKALLEQLATCAE